MTDRFDSMSILVAVVDGGSLSAGARSLGIPLPTVSRRIAELEERLGTQLLLRSARGLSLTDSGSTYLEACRRILEDVTEAERTAAGEYSDPKGLLTLTAPIVFGRLHVLPVISEFLLTHPEIAVRLEQTDRTISLREEHIDAAIRIGPLPDSGLRARGLGHVRLRAVAAPDYLDRAGRPEKPEDLGSRACVSFDKLTMPDRWRFGAGTDERTVAVRSRMVVNTAEAAIDAAVAGLGITRVLSYQCAQAVDSGRLEIVLKDWEPEPWPVSLVYNGGLVPRKLRAFIDFTLPRLRFALDRLS